MSALASKAILYINRHLDEVAQQRRASMRRGAFTASDVYQEERELGSSNDVAEVPFFLDMKASRFRGLMLQD